MRLPNAERARVDRAKVVDYLLSLEHGKGRGKAGFFLRFGFSRERWQEFVEALRVHVASYEAVVREDARGVNYHVDGIMQTPDGRDPLVRTVWAMDSADGVPRLVTAYPLRRRDVRGT